MDQKPYSQRKIQFQATLGDTQKGHHSEGDRGNTELMTSQGSPAMPNLVPSCEANTHTELLGPKAVNTDYLVPLTHPVSDI